MKPKNIKQQKLESNRFAFTQFGLIVALVITLFAFEWETTMLPPEIQAYTTTSVIETDVVINTWTKPPPPPPPIPPPSFTEVENSKKVTTAHHIDAGISPNDRLPDLPPIPKPEPEIVAGPEPPFIAVESMPEFPGGEQERLIYLQSNVRYPQLARETNIQGSVFVSFIVEKNGTISNVALLRGIGAGCDEEALRVVNAMPKWKPGYQLNKPVRVKFNMQVRFVLQ